MNSVESKSKLRLITYLAPGVSLELFHTIQHYLEEALSTESYLISECRWSGPPPDRIDPFTLDEVDIAFMCSSCFLRLIEEKNPHVELCPAATVHTHPKSEKRPVYFSDLIINSDNSEKLKDFRSLKGCRFGFNEPMSLSGNLAILAELKKRGCNSTFFADWRQTGSHARSLEMLLHNKVDAACIDSICLQYMLQEHPEHRDKITVLTSLGPLPIYPIVFNSRMSDEMKQKITDALLKMNTIPKWNEKLSKLDIFGFIPSDMSLYNMETDLRDAIKGLSISSVYY